MGTKHSLRDRCDLSSTLCRISRANCYCSITAEPSGFSLTAAVMSRVKTHDSLRTGFKRNVVDVCMRAAHDSPSYLRSLSTATSGLR